MSPAHASPPRRLARAGAALCLAAAVSVLAACGDDESSSEPKKLQVEATAAGKKIQVDAPKTADGGLVEMSFKNGAEAPQDAQLIRIEGDHSAKEILKVLGSDGGPIPSWLRGGGGVGQTAPGQTRTVTQTLPEGEYYVVVSGEGEGEPATKALTVEGGDGGDLPDADATVTAKEYSFSSSGLKTGTNRIRFENDGKELHHLIALPLTKGATIDEVKKAFGEEEPSGPPPFDEKAADGTAVLDGGESQVADLKLRKGKYALVCFIQDRKGGPPHAVKGMVSEADIR